MNTKNIFQMAIPAAALALAVVTMAPKAVASPIPAGWTCNGSCGSLGADGVVPLSPIGHSTYEFVTTAGGADGAGVLPTGSLGAETDGTTLSTQNFTVGGGTNVNFDFDYVTSDGSGNFTDYAWAALMDASNNPVAILFTARTEPSGSIVPGAGMPAPMATLAPPSVDIQSGSNWSPLGYYSGACYDVGCGNTGWVATSYTIGTAGTYSLEFGVTNWNDEIYDSGMAIDGVTINGQDLETPEPATWALMLGGLLALGLVVKREWVAGSEA